MQNIDLIDKFQSVEEDLAMGKELSEMTLEELWDLSPSSLFSTMISGTNTTKR